MQYDASQPSLIQQLRGISADAADSRPTTGQVANIGTSTIDVRIGGSGSVIRGVPVSDGVNGVVLNDPVYLIWFGPQALAISTRSYVGGASGPGTSPHNHDDLYYRKPSVDGKLAQKADVGHNHDPLWASVGYIGGWTIDANSIYEDHSKLSSLGYVSFGSTPPSGWGSNVGTWLGWDYGITDEAHALTPIFANDAEGGATVAGPKLSLYKDANNYLQWTGDKLLVKAANFTLDGSGNITATGATLKSASGNARVVLDGSGLAGYDAGGVQRTCILNDGSGWLGSSAVLSWTTAGVVTLNGSAVLPGTITGGKLNTYNVPTIDGLVITNNSPSGGYVAWGTFTLTHQGTSYTIAAGNSNAKHIYWRKSVSTTVLQTGATPPVMSPDQFMIIYNNGGIGIASLFANFIYSDFISTLNLSALSADLGTITAGTVTGATIRTAATGARVVLSSAAKGGLIGYGASDTYDPIGGSGTYQVFWDKTTGALKAGGGDVVIDAGGIKIGGTTTRLAFYDTNAMGNQISTIVPELSGSSSYLQFTATGFGATYRGGQIQFYTNNAAGTATNWFSLTSMPTVAGAYANLGSYGVFQGLRIGDANLPSVMLDVGGATKLGGALTWASDNTYDIGAAGATRPRSLYLGGSIQQSLAIGAQVYRNVAQSIGNAVWTTITFTTAISNSLGWVAGSRFTAPQAGFYLVTGSAEMDYLSATGYAGMSVWKNSNTRVAVSNQVTNVNMWPVVHCSAVVYLAASEWCELQVLQSSGGAVNTTAATAANPFWCQGAMVRIA